MLEIQNVTITTKQGRTLIDNVSFSVTKGDKLAIIGEEGNGKSTLLKAIYQKEEIQEYATIQGKIIKNNLTIGYLEQFLNCKWEDNTVLEYFLRKTPDCEINYDTYAQLYQIKNILKEIGLKSIYLEEDKKIGTLSGGEKVKLQIAKLRLQEPDILLLDEPTNDLDIETLNWLEFFLLHLTIPVIFISHDEVILEKVANAILHIEQVQNKTKTKCTYEHIGYQEYIKKRNDLIQRQEQIAKSEKREHEKQLEKQQRMYQQVQHDLESVSRQEPSKARLLKKKMKSVKSIGKKIEKEEVAQRPIVEEPILAKFHNEDTIYAKKRIVDIYLPKLRIQGKILSSNIHIQVVGKEKVGIIGNNGIGKTTLLKQIYQEIINRKDIKTGYMPQSYEDMLPAKVSPIDYLETERRKEQQTLARTYMGAMRFTQEEMKQPIERLSGGQKAKLILLKLILEQSNVLILDEPTRNLSPLSVPIINQLLKDFKGSIISVSHDRKFLETVCDTVYLLTEQGLERIQIG